MTVGDEKVVLPPPFPLRRASQTPEHMAAMRARQRELIEAGDEAAKGGRSKRRESSDELRSPDELKELAQVELQAQLRHRDPKIRRDAARLILELTSGRYASDEDDGIRKVVYETWAAPCLECQERHERERGDAS